MKEKNAQKIVVGKPEGKRIWETYAYIGG